VGRESKPYDRLVDGTVLTVDFDVLECGHTKRAQFPKTGTRRTGNALQESPPARERRCATCERDADVGPGCCDACEGKGGLGCWDCQGTGHTHPDTEDC
jgi:hypothetical protein